MQIDLHFRIQYSREKSILHSESFSISHGFSHDIA